MQIGFIMDPLDAVNIDADTTFAFMEAAQKRGHTVYYIRMQDMRFDRDRVYCDMRQCTVQRVVGDHFTWVNEREHRPMGELDIIFMRKDPPFDTAYLHATHYLNLVESEGTLVVNRPRGLQLANEKLFALNFVDALPDTIVSGDSAHILDFMNDVGGRCILKPIDGHGGEGIFMLKAGDRNNKVIIETMTNHGAERVMCQGYIEAVREGDKRIIMLNGEPLGGILRVPLEDDHRGNMHVGGTVRKTELTARDLEICAAVGPVLKREGLWFVGLDVIGDYLTEINVTSPTGIQEMSRLNGIDGADMVIEWAEKQHNA